MPPEPSQALRVFISYARRDASAFAEELLAGLEAAGFDAFLDRHDIAAGEDWEKRLGSLLQQADTVVYVLTPGSVKSERCAWEISRAEALAKRLIPVVALDVTEADTPPGLKRLNYIFFTPGNPFGIALRDLSAALRTDLDWIREHTRLFDLAVRWKSDPKPERLLAGSELAAAQAWMGQAKAGAPPITDAHREFIQASDKAEIARTSEERQRLEQITAAQTDRERALKQKARNTAIGIGVAAILAVVAAFGLFRAWRTGQALAATSQELQRQTSLLDQERDAAALKQDQLTQAQSALRLAQESLASTPPSPPPASSSSPSPAASGSSTPTSGTIRPSALPASVVTYNAVQEALKQATIAQGWDTDIFWCGGPDEGSHRAAAQRAQQLLLAEQERQLKPGAGGGSALFKVGRVRVRTLAADVNARPGYQVHSNVIRGEASETTQAETLSRFLANGGITVTVQTSAMNTPYYLSVFMCGGAGPAGR